MSALRDAAEQTGFAGGQREPGLDEELKRRGLETRTEVHDKMPSRRGREGTGSVELEYETRGIHAGSETSTPQLPRRRRERECLWRREPSPIGKREQADRQQPITSRTPDDGGQRCPGFKVHDRDVRGSLGHGITCVAAHDVSRRPDE